MEVGFDKGGKDTTVLVVYCPQKGVSRRQAFVSRVMSDMGYDVLTKPLDPKICGSNPVSVIVDEWPMLESN